MYVLCSEIHQPAQQQGKPPYLIQIKLALIQLTPLNVINVTCGQLIFLLVTLILTRLFETYLIGIVVGRWRGSLSDATG